MKLSLRHAIGAIRANIYNVRFYSKFRANPNLLIDYEPINDMKASEESLKFLRGKDPSCLNLEKPAVLQVTTPDTERDFPDEFGTVTCASTKKYKVKYGKYGIMPSETKTPVDLLTQELLIDGGNVGIVTIRKHVPFRIETEDPDQTFVMHIRGEVSEVFEHKDNIERYSLNTLAKLESPEQAKQLSLSLQKKIFHDKGNEYFYEEVTSKVYKPTIHNRSSGTLMHFAQANKATASHYHPGERSLIIVTTDKPAGVTLNFCGIAENPDKRTDCKKYIKFPKNSLIVLNFPPYTHHKFHGEFDCMSVHPREGINLIEAVQSGTLSKGFLESATVFSKTENDHNSWKMSLPEARKNNSNNHSR